MSGAESAAAISAAPTTMRAAVLAEPGMTRIDAVPRPEPGAGEVRIQLQGCGVCGSNLPVWEGQPWFQYPLEPGAPGHEGWGVVDAIGPAVDTVQPGDRVAVMSQRAFAEYDVAPAEACVRLPPALAERPFPGEPLGCAVNVFRRSEIGRGDTVVVIGIGFIGAVVARLASRAGATVIAVSRRPFALEIARAQGADIALPLDDYERVVGEVEHLTGGTGADRVIEAIGLQGPLDLAARLTRIRGRLVIAGYHQDGPRQVDMQLWNWRGLDVINAHERDATVVRDGVRAAVELVAEGVLDTGPLFTHRVELARLGDALELVRARPDGFLKALVVP
ncbi:MAG TPA: zinc-binding dehydrogenase [Gemmatimonadales bacterium]|nr:zinc-binding dehydrogenase [Gemmatimonadales bacterium]